MAAESHISEVVFNYCIIVEKMLVPVVMKRPQIFALICAALTLELTHASPADGLHASGPLPRRIQDRSKQQEYNQPNDLSVHSILILYFSAGASIFFFFLLPLIIVFYHFTHIDSYVMYFFFKLFFCMVGNATDV